MTDHASLLDLEIEPDPPSAASVELEIEPDALVRSVEPVMALVEVLGPDVALPLLVKFVPDVRLRDAASQATSYALGIDVTGPEGFQQADVALVVLRNSQADILQHFAEPADIANRLHKRITGLRSEWADPGDAAIKTVGKRVWAEQQRRSAIDADARRKAQEDADRVVRDERRREAEAAAKAKAPEPVVTELRRQAETATAPPVAPPMSAPAMRSNTATTTWKARVAGTPGDAEPNPEMADLSGAQVAQVHRLLRDILDGKAPITLLDLNWSVFNNRAKADKSTFAIAGFEAFQDGGIRAKGTRR